jgi:hypothetical protein
MFGKFVRRFLAFVLAAAAVLLLPLAMWISSAQRAFLNADTYKNGLQEQNIYVDLAQVGMRIISNQVDEAQNDSFIQFVDSTPPEVRNQVTSILLPPEWVQTQIEHGLDIFFGWLKGEITNLGAPLDFSGLQARLRGEEGQRVIDIIIDNSPPCNPDQIGQIESYTAGSIPRNIPACLPPPEQRAALHDMIAASMLEMADRLATRAPTLERLLGTERDQQAQRFPVVVSAGANLLAVFYLCPAALLSLVVVFVVRSFRTFGRWAGWMGIASAFIAILPLPVLSNSIISNVTAEITRSPQPAEMQLFQVRLLTGLLSSGFAQFSAPVVAQALFLALVAVVLLVVSSMQARPPDLPVSVMLEDSPTITAPSGKISTASTRRTGQIDKPEVK